MFKLSKNVWLLSLLQPLVVSTGGLNSVVGSIVGEELSNNSQIATLPIGAYLLGITLFVIPATKLQQIFGRKLIFVTASLLSALAAFMAATSIELRSFTGFVVACFLLGTQLAVIAQYRYAAMESCSSGKQHAKAVSMILIGGISSAVVGPELIQVSDWLPVFSSEYANAYLFIVVFHLIAAILLLVLFDSSQLQQHEPEKEVSSVSQGQLSSSMYKLAIFTALSAYVVMALIMIATPLAMKNGGYELESIKWVIQAHILAMYVPSLFTATLIEKIGIHKMLMAGVVINILCIAISLMSQDFEYYMVALVLLGVGWNMLFLSGTTLLPQTYTYHNRYKAQGTFDLSISIAQTSSAILAGVLLSFIGWNGLLIACLLPLVILIVISLNYIDDFPKLDCCNVRLIPVLNK